MLKSKLVTLGLLVVAGAVGFGLYAYRSPLPEMTVEERPEFDAATIEKGRILAAAGYCATCHTSQDGGAPYAGNYEIATGFGSVYGSNLTPDPETGIGRWSPEAFRRAMQEGVDREGRRLFPAIPYDHFTKMSDEDIDAIYAFIMAEVEPVRQETKPPTIPFPLNIRFLQAGWGLLFVDYGRFEPEEDKSDAWNRGAYLAQGVAHCGACHTPRNLLGAERRALAYEGATIDAWTAPALTASNPSAIPWSAKDYETYLATGATPWHGAASGPMGPVVHAGIRELPQSDLAAIGTYFADINGAPESDPAKDPAVQEIVLAGKPDRAYRQEMGERLFASACASCHYNSSAERLSVARPELGINSALRLDDPSNLIHVILDGIAADQGTQGVVMPGFRHALDDTKISAIAAYLRASRTELAPWQDLEAQVSTIRAHQGTH